MEITKKERIALKAIVAYVEEHKYPPTVRELSAILGLKSSSTGHGYLKRLKRKGAITWEQSNPRTIKVLKES